MMKDLIIELRDTVLSEPKQNYDKCFRAADALEQQAAVLPEGWVAVPKDPTLAMLGCLRSDITSNLEKRYQAMLAAAPKLAQAEKQEPVKDEPVAWCQDTENEITPEFGFSWVKTRLHDVPLYTRPQPDLTAEVEFMQGKYEEMLDEWLPQKQRIAALEEAAQQARDAIAHETKPTYLCFAECDNYHPDPAPPTLQEAFTKLDAVLGNAEITGG